MQVSESIARIREILDTSNSPFVLGQELVKVVNALEVADRTLKNISVDAVSDNSVDNWQKSGAYNLAIIVKNDVKLAREARAEISRMLSGEGK